MDQEVTKSDSQTIKLGKKFGQHLSGGDVVGLFGELGAGKTTFVKGVAKGLGIKQTVNSPSYMLLKIYHLPDSDLKLAHFDFYRLGSNEQQAPADLSDYIYNSEYICLIEWAGKVQKYLTKRYIRIDFQYRNSWREINIKK
jgi:tRNA threonylcarbamoyladenosine biosynthesis protein TsaE